MQERIVTARDVISIGGKEGNVKIGDCMSKQCDLDICLEERDPPIECWYASQCEYRTKKTTISSTHTPDNGVQYGTTD